MKIFKVTGMKCAGCQARVEKAVLMLDGIESCNVNLLTNSMSVEGVVSSEDIIKAVLNAGYNAVLIEDENSSSNDILNDDFFEEDEETPFNFKNFISSLIFLIPLLYLSFGYNALKLPLPDFLTNSPFFLAAIQMVLSAVIIIINRSFFISGFKGLFCLNPNMDSLVSLGSSASFVWSFYKLFLIFDSQFNGAIINAIGLSSQLYFESSAMVLVLISLGRMLEDKTKGKTTNALKALIDLAPKTATLIIEGKEVSVPIANVKVDDVFILRPGSKVPVDGIVIYGESSVDESSLTGESIPVDKSIGDKVSAGTINLSGFIKCRTTHIGKDTTLSQIVKLIADSAATKAPIAKTADKVASIFVPVVLCIALITLIIWLLVGSSVDFALERAISVLVISCPCALGLATPVVIMVANGLGAKNGLLFKNSLAFENAGNIKIIAFDKTGTITKGKPEVVGVHPAKNIKWEQMFDYAYSLESKSEHPLAHAIVNKAKTYSANLYEAKNFEVIPGKGIIAEIGGDKICTGSYSFISNIVEISKEYLEYASRGLTTIFVSKNNELLGCITIADSIKEDSKNSIEKLKNLGILPIMLTGDNKQTAKNIAKKCGIEYIASELLPNEKSKLIEKLKKFGKLAMVGDGINDAPALTSADLGIAIGAGSDIAIDSADVILMNSKLKDVVGAIRLGRAAYKNIRLNLFWAFIYNALCIPLAAGCFYYLFGLTLNPMIAAAVMSLSSICVCSNALRLNWKNIYDDNHDKKISNPIKDLTNNLF